MRPYVIHQGDCLSRLAARFGFDEEQVWNHERNRSLREVRASPDILAPGDVLFIPAPARTPGLRVQPATTNRYSGRPQSVPIRVLVLMGREILRNEPCEVISLGPPQSTQTDGDGLLSFEVPHHLDEVRVRFPSRHFDLTLRIGHLDPIDQPSGVAARLENLGYLLPSDGLMRVTGSADNLRSQAAQRLRVARALVSFQRDHGLDPTGELDDATRAALRESHGA